MLRTAERYYRTSARFAQRAATRATAAASTQAAAVVIVQHQAAAALEASTATTAMLTEQGLTVAAEALLNPVAFTTGPAEVKAMMATILDDLNVEFAAITAEIEREAQQRFEQLAASLVQDAGRAAQLVDVTARPRVSHVRHLNLPSCSRCVVLAGRVYRYSEGFKRHPNCDCVMIPTTVAAPDLTYDPAQLARDGLVRGLSKADVAALDDGADFGQVVNVRSRSAGLLDAGQALIRGGRPTPAGIYRIAGDDRDLALSLLAEHGYLR